MSAFGSSVANFVLAIEPRHSTSDVRIGSVRQNDLVTVAFPISERTDSVDIRMGDSHGQYSLVRRGNDVVSIFPRGRYYPFYQQRGHYRTGEPRWRKVERFVSDESVDQ